MTLSRPAGSTFAYPRKALISAFIIFQSIVVCCQAFPDSPLQREINDRTNRFVRFFGFEQSYAVFVVPRKINKHLIGVITYKSGLTELFNYPRVEQFNIIEKIRFERFRKFFSDNLDSDAMKDCREDFAAFIAHTHNNPVDPPYAVSLQLVTKSIPAPGAPNTESVVKMTPFVSYLVQPADLN